MDRKAMLRQLESDPEWDICIIGGGATGLGAAVDAASRGYRTLLLEGADFAKGTSSRSTKLVHGGVRYLQQGNIKLVMEALHERGLLLKNAPHLTRNLSFIVPNYKWWEAPFYGIGLKVYDWMSGKLGLGPSEMLSREEVLEQLPTLDPEGLRGGTIYHDGQFDDARLAINLAQTAADFDACLLNYMKVESLHKSGRALVAIGARDLLSGETHQVRAKTFVNATGIFVDEILNLDSERHEPIVQLSQGIHLVVDRSFMPGNNAIMVPKTDDGRVLFAVPWHNRLIIGTTDTPVSVASLEPQALESEFSFVLQHIGRYLTRDPQREDVKSVFAGLRPLVRPEKVSSTSSISREHTILVSDSGLVTITGGKWTTYRKMAKDVIDMTEISAGIAPRECKTEELQIHGAENNVDTDAFLSIYGSDANEIRQLIDADPTRGELLHPDLPYSWACVDWAVRQEMAMTVDDVLARRTRSLLLDARAARAIAPAVAERMAILLGKDQNWIQNQVEQFSQLSAQYIPVIQAE